MEGARPVTRIDDLPIRDELRGQSPYGAPQLDVPVRLNTNENPYPLPEPLVERIAERVREAARELNRYPDRDAVELRTELAEYLTAHRGHPVSRRERLGGQRLQRGHPAAAADLRRPRPQRDGLRALVLDARPDLARHRHRLDLRAAPATTSPSTCAAAQAAIAELRPDVLFICSPNNPTGTAVDADTVLALYEAAQAAKPSLVVVDEAYGEFSHRPSLLPLIEGRPHLVVTRTMSKAFGAAGLRLGYLAADPAVVDAVQLVRLPYHLSAVTQATALAALEHTDTLLGYVELLKTERDRLVTELRAMGLEVTESDANFVQFGRFDDAHAAWQALLDRGVLVRDNGVPGWLRVTAGTPAENDAFLEAVRELKKET